MNFQVAEFIKSANNKVDHLNDYDQVLFIGKSNVGKSSLINALTNKKNLAYVSKTPGQTKLINYYLIAKKFYLVDAPGFGYRRLAYVRDDFDRLMDEYLTDNQCLKLVVYLVDGRRDIDESVLDVIDYIEEKGYHVLVIFTKYDTLKQSDKSRLNTQIKNFNIDEYLYSSFKDAKLIKQIQDKIASYIE